MVEIAGLRGEKFSSKTITDATRLSPGIVHPLIQKLRRANFIEFVERVPGERTILREVDFRCRPMDVDERHRHEFSVRKERAECTPQIGWGRAARREGIVSCRHAAGVVAARRGIEREDGIDVSGARSESSWAPKGRALTYQPPRSSSSRRGSLAGNTIASSADRSSRNVMGCLGAGDDALR